MISKLDVASQLWSPHKNSQIEQAQRSFTKHITEMRDLRYDEKLQVLTLYSLLTTCSVCNFKQRLDFYLNNIPDLPCCPGFNNSLDGGN